MTDRATLHVEPTGQRIIECLRTRPDGLANPKELVEQLQVGEEEVRSALAKLERLGLVDRGHNEEGREEYILNPAAARL